MTHGYAEALPQRHMGTLGVAGSIMKSATAVILDQPKSLRLGRVDLTGGEANDVVVDIDWSSISTGTERLLWSGDMPAFPGMGYPLVPGYESIGHIVEAGQAAVHQVGDTVFVPGARCFGDVRGLFGGASSRVIVSDSSVLPIDSDLKENGVLIALAATSYHALAADGARKPALIIGHGVVGRLLARLALAMGAPPPVVWETNPARRMGAQAYHVVDPADDDRADYPCIYDASGDPSILDTLISRLGPYGEVVLAGFYAKPLSFAFPPAFMREARIRIAAEWKPDDLAEVSAMISDGRLSLDGLITHRADATHAVGAYETAFNDAECLKMILDWRAVT